MGWDESSGGVRYRAPCGAYTEDDSGENNFRQMTQASEEEQQPARRPWPTGIPHTYVSRGRGLLCDHHDDGYNDDDYNDDGYNDNGYNDDGYDHNEDNYRHPSYQHLVWEGSSSWWSSYINIKVWSSLDWTDIRGEEKLHN